MRRLFALLLVMLMAAGPGSFALAWGPYTHVAIGKRVLERLRGRPDSRLAFLLREPARTLFLAASMGPDMTLSVSSFGKTDRAFDKRLHDEGLCRRLVRQALDEQDPERTAFALGWYSHLLADRVMCAPGGIIYRNLFELSPTTNRRLSSSVAELIKVVIDAIHARSDPAILRVVGRFDGPLLADCLTQVAQARGRPRDPELEAKVSAFIESFASTLGTMRELSRSLAANDRAFPSLQAELTEFGADGRRAVPGIAESAAAIRDKLEGLVPSGLRLDGPEIRPPPPSVALGFLDRVAASLTRRGRAAVAGGGLASRVTQSAISGFLHAMNGLGVAAERTLSARIMATFMGELLSNRKDWPSIRAAIRAVAERPEDEQVESAGPGDPEGASDDAPLDGEP